LGLHAIEAAFHRRQSLLCRKAFIFVIVIVLLRCQAANQMVILCVLPGTSHQVRDAFCIASIAYVEVI
jgi:hypothetical protein